MYKTFSSKNLTRGSLFFLLTWRLFLSISVYQSGKLEMTKWMEIAFLCTSYSMISIILWINKKELREINVDKNFVGIFIMLGIIYSFLMPSTLGILLGIAIILNVGVFFSASSSYAKSELSHISFLIFLVILLILDYIYFIVIQKARLFVSDTVFLDAVFWANLPFIVAEEILFRGLLWKLLRDFKFTENVIIYIQAFLFWICHFYIDSVFFWFFLPLISILLGYLTSRAKSITPSIFLHLLHNIFGFIFRY